MAETAFTPAQLAEFDHLLEQGIATNMAIAAQFDDVAAPEAIASMAKHYAETTVALLGAEQAVVNLGTQVAALALRQRRLMLERDRAGA